MIFAIYSNMEHSKINSFSKINNFKKMKNFIGYGGLNRLERSSE